MTRWLRFRLKPNFQAGATLALVAAVAVFGGIRHTRAQQPAKWSAAVRVFSADANGAGAASPGMMRPNSDSSSRGLPPQYQTTRRIHAGSEPPANDATLRFIVPLVERPILVEARVTVDGQPFQMRRERRIDQLLKELSEPVPAPMPAAPTDNPAANTVRADAAESPPKPATDNSFPARLRRYVGATNRVPSRDEVRWLLTNWANGPTLLWLDENYQRVRANASPLFTIVDRDEDGVLSPAEIAAAADNLWKYDANQDEVLSLAEISKGAERTPAYSNGKAVVPPVIPLEQMTVASTFRLLCENFNSPLPQFDRNGDGAVSDAELAELRGAPADLLIRVAFDTQESGRSRLDVVANDRTPEIAEAAVRESSLTLLSGRTLLEFSAVQSGNMPDTDQISLGAVRDGYPLLPELDANEDGRLTVRELRDVSERLAKFDRDRDGSVARAELFPTLRVSFGLGPIVHRQLASVRSVHPPISTPPVEPPEWFSRMDRNQDGDLSPREFLGGKEQFVLMDEDKDGLISIAEAQAHRK